MATISPVHKIVLHVEVVDNKWPPQLIVLDCLVQWEASRVKANEGINYRPILNRTEYYLQQTMYAVTVTEIGISISIKRERESDLMIKIFFNKNAFITQLL